MMRKHSLFALIIVICHVHRAEAITGDEIIIRAQKAFEKATALSASFQQTFTWKLAGRRQQSNGTILIKKPGMLRLETDQQIIVSDGMTSWTYSPEHHQVIIAPYRESDATFSPKAFLLEYSVNYQTDYIGEESVKRRPCYVVKLTAKGEEEDITEIKAWVDKRQWVTRKVEYTDVSGNVSSYIISRVKINPKFEPSTFRFDIPKGAEVVDMR
ncbi:MAG: outer membrane lipoprotein chaperone LolA [Candidatus Latescibacteria bacterium]|nr:outer membrane lipoprotein chaperone LolA [Candidatus Latescibacterota bacterium]